MLITQREAASRLGQIGVTRRHALRILAAGFAGDPVRTSAACLYDADLVNALVGRPLVSERVEYDLVQRGLFVARRDIDVRRPWVAQAEAVCGGWNIGVGAAAFIRVCVARLGPLPLVGTVAGLVATTAEILDVESGADNRCRLVLQRPAAWADEVRDRILISAPGAPWQLPLLRRFVDGNGRLPALHDD